MKRLIASMLFAAAATAFAACSQVDDEVDNSVVVPDVPTVELTLSTGRPDADADSRTMIAADGTTPMWCSGDAIGVSVHSGGAYTNAKFTNDKTEPAETTTFTGSTAVGGTLYTYYPYTETEVSASGEVVVTIPAVQHPTATSFDGAADLLVGEPLEMPDATTTTIEGLRFKRVSGILRIVLNDKSGLLTGEAVDEVSVTAGELPLAGDVVLDLVGAARGAITGDTSSTLTARYTADGGYVMGAADAAAYYCLYPQTLPQGTVLKVKALTAGHEIARDVTLPYDVVVAGGRITALTVSVTEENISGRTLTIPDNMEQAFPDPIFRKYVLDNFDKDNDGKISPEEALKVDYIYVSQITGAPDEEKIASLEGIQYFSNLTVLHCDNNKLTTLDVSNNTALTMLWCSSNQLTGLNVSRNIVLNELDCRSNQLTSLDVSNNTALTRLVCINNRLTSLDVSKNTTLEYLPCSKNQLTTLDVSNNTALWLLNCSSNQLTSLDVSNNTALTSLDCYSNQLTSLDVTLNTELGWLRCQSNQLTSLDVSNNTALWLLNCSSNQLTTLDVSNNTALESLSCESNQLTDLDVSKNTALERLECHSNLLTSLDVSNTNFGNSSYVYPLDCAPMETLQTLYLKKGWEIPYIYPNRDAEYIPEQTKIVFVDENENADMVKAFPDPIFRAYVLEHFDTDNDGKISAEEALAVTTINVSNSYEDRNNDGKTIKSLEGIQYFSNLTYLDCNYNKLTNLDLPKNTALTRLRCSSNQLTSLDVSKNTALIWLECGANQLTSLDVSNNTALETLICGSNPLTDLDLSKNTALEHLDCSWNQLTSLDVSKNTALGLLSCSSNQLTDLDVSNNTALTWLSCSSNPLTDLDVSNNTALTNLVCSWNQLTSLDVSNNTALTDLDCSWNQLTTLDVSNTNMNGGYLDCAPMETLQTLYLKKGWKIDGIYLGRNDEFIPEQTRIRFLDEMGNETMPDNEIHYFSTDGKIVEPVGELFGDAKIVSNTYKNGEGVIVFDREVTTIGNQAFHSRENLMHITLPESVTKIGVTSFWMCSNLLSVTMGSNITSIGESAFMHCTQLWYVKISEAMQTIDRLAFAKCAALETVTIPKNVTSIGSDAFSECRALTEMVCEPTTPPAGGSHLSDSDNALIYVPSGSEEAYKAAWPAYADRIRVDQRTTR